VTDGEDVEQDVFMQDLIQKSCRQTTEKRWVSKVMMILLEGYRLLSGARHSIVAAIDFNTQGSKA